VRGRNVHSRRAYGSIRTMAGVRVVVRAGSAALRATFVVIVAATGCLGRTPLDEYQPEPGFGFDAGLGGSGVGGSSNGGTAGFTAGGGVAGGFMGDGGFVGDGGFPGEGGVAAGGRVTGGRPSNGGDFGTGGIRTGGRPGTGGLGTGGAFGCSATCDGCCDAAGICRPGTATNACGLNGVRCLDCGSSGFDCDQGTCQGTPPACSPATCAGCCDTLGRCRSGAQTDACGFGGDKCTNCGAQSKSCTAGSCVGAPPPCGVSSCGGCCDATGTCRVGTANGVCGTNGDACENCTANGRTCNQPGSYCAYIPSCSALTCPSGCCSASGVCQDGRTDTACGSMGQACSNCETSGQHCSGAGYCYTGPHCGPDNCNGCCTPNGTCAPGTGPRNCGLYGNACDNCFARGETCQGGACGVVGAICPAPYPGCTPNLMTTPPTQSRSCTPSDLDAVAKACPTLSSSSGCTAQVVSLSSSNPGCFDCLQQFLYDGAAVKCLAPFLTAACNQALSCATECVTAACDGCSTGEKQPCRDQAFQSGGECASYVTGYFCARAAFDGPAAFCDITTIGSVGGFLRGVGAYYCSP
jgi:hypothetical protein